MGVGIVIGVNHNDPGDIYVIEHANRYKIGRSKDALRRLREARTWLPDMRLIGVKPFWNVAYIERCMHAGFAHCWYSGEWFDLLDEGYQEVLIEGFRMFSDSDRDRNSMDFISWFNSDGMAEVLNEMHEQGLSLAAFQRQESHAKKE